MLYACRVTVDVKPLPDMESTASDDDQQVFIAFARVFSGTVRRGQMLYVLGPKHDPCKLPDAVSLLTQFLLVCVVLLLTYFTYMFLYRSLDTGQLFLLFLTVVHGCLFILNKCTFI